MRGNGGCGMEVWFWLVQLRPGSEVMKSLEQNRMFGVFETPLRYQVAYS